MTMKSLSSFWEVKDNGFLPGDFTALDSLIDSSHKTFVLDMPEMNRQNVVEYFSDRSKDIENDLLDITSTMCLNPSKSAIFFENSTS